MPSKRPHITQRSAENQAKRTPPGFIEAVQKRFGPICFDLAAGVDNAIVARFFSKEDDALTKDWSKVGKVGEVVWLNPEFKRIAPYAAKLEAECRRLPWWTLCLVPASMSCFWWGQHVLNKCFALGVSRMTFVGETAPFPKDLALLCYGFGVSGTGFWQWHEPKRRVEI